MTPYALPCPALPSPCAVVLPSAGNEEKNFHLQPDGRLLVLKDLDRELEALFTFIVKASSNRSWTPPHGPSADLDLVTDLSLQEVRVVIEDINDQPPRFTKAEYTAGAGAGAWARGGGGPRLPLTPICPFLQEWPLTPRWARS